MITPRFALIVGAALLYFTALGSHLPTIPHYVEEVLGGGGVAVGVSVGAFSIAAAIMRPWAGRMGDRFGRRAISVAGCGIMAASVACYGIGSSFGVLLAARIFSGLGEAAAFVGFATAVQDLAPPHRRGEAASLFSVSLYSGLALGPALGEWIVDQWGYGELWAISAALIAAATLLCTGFPGRTGAEVAPQGPLLYRKALAPGGVLALGMIPFAGFGAYVALYAENIGVGQVGGVFFLYAVVVVGVRIFGARLPDRLGWRVTTTISLVAVGFAVLLIALWQSATALWIAAALMGVGMSLLFPALFTAAVTDVPDEERSQAVGSFSMFFDLSSGLGAPALGVVVALSSYRGAFATAALIAVVALFALRRLSRALPAHQRR